MNQVNRICATTTTPEGLDTTADGIEAARAYERIFVPALFRQWPRHLIATTDIRPGHRALDIACGTGILARMLADHLGTTRDIVGIDINRGMLEVAADQAPDISWRHGDAVALPFEDGEFDYVYCQFGLMFFSDPSGALTEAARVLRPGGRLVFAVWDTLENNPGFAEKVAVLDRVAGTAAGDALRAPFCLGKAGRLVRLAGEAGLEAVSTTTVNDTARFHSLHEFVEAEVRGWLPVMGVHLDEETISEVHSACRRSHRNFVNRSDGSLDLPAAAHLLHASR